MIALYVLVLALLWLGVAVIAYRLWNAYFVPERGIARPVRVIGGWVLLLGWMFVPGYLLFGRTAMLDAEVKELCARDGGINVYETVRLPKERFGKYGNLNVPSRNYAKPTDEYYFETNEKLLRAGDPLLVRSVAQIIRRADGKVLGESIRYGRSGGDIPGPWHPTTFDCPQIRDAEGQLEISIFLKEGAEK